MFNRRSWFVWFANCNVLDLRSFVSQAKNGLAMALNEEDPKDAATGMVSKLQGIVSEEQAHDAQQDVLVGMVCGLQHLRSLIVYLPGKEWL